MRYEKKSQVFKTVKEAILRKKFTISKGQGMSTQNDRGILVVMEFCKTKRWTKCIFLPVCRQSKHWTKSVMDMIHANAVVGEQGKRC